MDVSDRPVGQVVLLSDGIIESLYVFEPKRVQRIVPQTRANVITHYLDVLIRCVPGLFFRV